MRPSLCGQCGPFGNRPIRQPILRTDRALPEPPQILKDILLDILDKRRIVPQFIKPLLELLTVAVAIHDEVY